MSSAFSNIVQDKQEIKYQLSTTHPAVNPVAKLFPENLEFVEVVTKYTKDTLDGTTMVWGSTTQGNWGDNWGSSAVASSELYAVIPRDNTFIEYFGQDEYIDTANSTGTLDTAAETYDLTAGQVLQSEVIAKYRAPINSARVLSHADLVDAGGGMILPFKLGVDTFNTDSVTLELSNDGGSTWQPANEGETVTFPTTSVDDELIYRITAVSAVTISAPIFIRVN